ncbi:MAG: SDR family oxidoreductase [Flavobacteriales bacterium]|nr:SDR family oxidoreductase [Flavobacteriales bacterium]
MEIELNNKNAIVCGSTEGIGKASAIELAKLGANITLISRNEEKLKKVLTLLDTSAGQTHSYLVADFKNTTDLEKKIQALDDKFHILINNTGGPAAGAIIDADSKAFEEGFKMHIVCNQILVKKVMSGMKEEGYGRIVNVISTSVKSPIPGLGVSNTIRAAVANWAKTLSLELGPYGITVNNILPGFTNTNRLKSLIASKAEKEALSEQKVIENMKSTIPAKRFGEASETANAVAFLCSPAAAYINGINLPVDGGRTACL